jgi:hypothetical protein
MGNNSSALGTPPLPLKMADEFHKPVLQPMMDDETPKLPPPRLPPSKKGELVTVLCLDGGGIRALISSIILADLEKKLQVNHLFHFPFDNIILKC